MFISIFTTLLLGSVIGVITSVSVYGFIFLVKFLTLFLEIQKIVLMDFVVF